MNKSETFHLGYIARIVGTRGEIQLALDVDNPSRYAGIDALFLEVDGLLSPFFVKQSRLNRDELVLQLEGFESPDEAKTLVGLNAYLPLGALEVLDETRFYFHEIGGYKVIDEQFGAVGIAQEVIDRAMQPVLRVLSDQTEILLPLPKGAVVKIDRKLKELFVRMPEGLIGLYLDPSDEAE